MGRKIPSRTWGLSTSGIHAIVGRDSAQSTALVLFSGAQGVEAGDEDNNANSCRDVGAQKIIGTQNPLSIAEYSSFVFLAPLCCGMEKREKGNYISLRFRSSEKRKSEVIQLDTMVLWYKSSE